MHDNAIGYKMKTFPEISPKVFESELDFFPLYNGLKPSSMGLKKIEKHSFSQNEKDKIFLFGESFSEFRKSKENCRIQDLTEYYQSLNKYPEIVKYIFEVLIN